MSTDDTAGVRFLSEEWAVALTDALNADDAFRDTTRKKQVVMLFRVTGTPTGDTAYYMDVDRGTTRIVIGEPEKADLTFESSYDVACRIAQGTLNGRDAVTRKQMKADANIMRLMKFASIFTERHNAESTLEVAY
jgi:hypothetical protein